jgi:hypothetical protein
VAVRIVRPLAVVGGFAAVVLAISAWGSSGHALVKSHLTLAALESRIGVIQYSLRRGTIVAAGVYSAAPGVVVPKGGVTRAVIGGTGKYLGASGQVVQTPLANGNIKNVFTLLAP